MNNSYPPWTNNIFEKTEIYVIYLSLVRPNGAPREQERTGKQLDECGLEARRSFLFGFTVTH
jgi:hypothetical protein